MQSSFEFITPADAERALAASAGQLRNSSEQAISSMADDMIAGRWDGSNLVAVVFDSSGKLIDGGTRMHAVLEAARRDPEFKGVSMLVVREYDK